MNKKIKLAFLALLIISFGIVSIIVILQAQGYDFDWEKNEVFKTGGIYIKTAESGADVFIDNAYISKTDGFTREILAQKMLAGKHNVKVQKEGYFTWEKNLTVEEQMVAKAQNIVLFPNNTTFKLRISEFSSIYNIIGQNFLVLKTNGDLIIVNSNTKEEQSVLSAAKLKDVGKIKNVVFSSDQKRALVVSTANIYYLLEINGAKSQITLLKDLDKNSEGIIWDGATNLNFINKNKLYSLNTSTKKKELIKEEAVTAFARHSEGLYTMEEGILIRTNTFTKGVEIMTKDAFTFKKNSKYELKIIEGRIFLVEDNKIFYYYDGKTKALTKVLESSSEINYKTLSDKVIFITDYGVWLMLLKDYESPFFKKSESFILLSNFSQKISDIVWVADDYFAATINGKIKINEIDNRDKINSFELTGDGYSKLWFDSDNKSLLVVKGSELYESTRLVP
ncbi:MAG: PEGA domain-containing protein [Candidatus Pacebacteria bacterium]|nr:PEGA domain-containing protein [Candidatus Paceibacterota bacterium]